MLGVVGVGERVPAAFRVLAGVSGPGVETRRLVRTRDLGSGFSPAWLEVSRMRVGIVLRIEDI